MIFGVSNDTLDPYTWYYLSPDYQKILIKEIHYLVSECNYTPEYLNNLEVFKKILIINEEMEKQNEIKKKINEAKR